MAAFHDNVKYPGLREDTYAGHMVTRAMGFVSTCAGLKSWRFEVREIPGQYSQPECRVRVRVVTRDGREHTLIEAENRDEDACVGSIRMHLEETIQRHDRVRLGVTSPVLVLDPDTKVYVQVTEWQFWETLKVLLFPDRARKTVV